MVERYDPCYECGGEYNLVMPRDPNGQYVEWDNFKQLQDENTLLKQLLSSAKCPNCDGSGGIPRQTSSRQCVSRDMAIDAGMPELEGSLYCEEQWEIEHCQWCFLRDEALK